MPKLLREYKTGEKVDSVCMLTSLTVKETRQQKPYLRLEFGDSSGRVAGVMWEGFDQEVTETPQGTILRIEGKMEEWEGRAQVSVKRINLPPPGSYDPAALLPSSERDTGKMLAELDSIIETVGSRPLHGLLCSIFGDSRFRGQFAKAPAAKRWHQPYVGGLLEHTLNVHSHAVALARRYPGVETDLVTAGALVHDIGKTAEYSLETFFETSTRGRLLGHLVIGVEILGDWIRSTNEFPEKVGWHLKHIILSHHGRLEFGSPVLPRTLEALIVHFADDLDAKMSGVMRIMEREREEPKEWTSYVKLMEREFFKGTVLKADPDEGAKGTKETGEAGKGNSRQEKSQEQLGFLD
ncbi:MAG: HD domain-containing protein [Gemmatimonadota bacterium]|nr:HD domain-containing protein [Gemmatimonadota bacterium]